MRKRFAKRYRFDNLPDSEIVDQFGDACEGKSKHTVLRKEIIRRGLKEATGDAFILKVESKSSTIFDHDACRSALGDLAYQELWKKVETEWVQAYRKLEDEEE